MNFSAEPRQTEQQPVHYFLHRIPSASDTWPPSLQEHEILESLMETGLHPPQLFLFNKPAAWCQMKSQSLWSVRLSLCQKSWSCARWIFLVLMNQCLWNKSLSQQRRRRLCVDLPAIDPLTLKPETVSLFFLSLPQTYPMVLEYRPRIDFGWTTAARRGPHTHTHTHTHTHICTQNNTNTYTHTCPQRAEERGRKIEMYFCTADDEVHTSLW